jgi:hypothetical protein
MRGEPEIRVLLSARQIRRNAPRDRVDEQAGDAGARTQLRLNIVELS